MLSALMPTLASRVLSNLHQLETRLRLPTPPHANPNLGSIPVTAPLAITRVEERTAPPATGTGTLWGNDLAHPYPAPPRRKRPPRAIRERTLPKGSQGDQASSDHYLPIGVDCDHCSNLSGRGAAGEAGRTVPGPAPAASGPRTRCGPKPGPREARVGGGGRGSSAASLLRGGPRSRRGLGGRGSGTARLPEGGEGAQPGRLCVSALPASHFWGREAARPPTAGRASACSGSLAGRDGAAARRRAPRRGRPHPRARALGAG